MNKIKVYLDTSVISYLDQKDAPERNTGYVGTIQNREQGTELKIIEKTFADKSECLFYVERGIRDVCCNDKVKIIISIAA